MRNVLGHRAFLDPIIVDRQLMWRPWRHAPGSPALDGRASCAGQERVDAATSEVSHQAQNLAPLHGLPLLSLRRSSRAALRLSDLDRPGYWRLGSAVADVNSGPTVVTSKAQSGRCLHNGSSSGKG